MQTAVSYSVLILKQIVELFKAIESDDVDAARNFLHDNPDFDVNALWDTEYNGDKFTWTPLHCAAYYGRIQILGLLMNRGAKVEVQDTWYGATALAWATYGGMRQYRQLPRLMQLVNSLRFFFLYYYYTWK